MVKKMFKLTGSEPPTQRSRGRPPKLKPKPTASQSAKRGRGRPKKIGLSLGPSPSPSPGLVISPRRGRPPRSKLPKRPGRPPKPKSVSAISTALKRPPGRPPKAQSALTVVAPVAVTLQPIPNGSPRPRGRPKKTLPALGAPPLSAPRGRPRGRPRGLFSVIRPGRPQKPARRPVGRPKGATAAAVIAHKAANEDLRKKLEHFQSKVKESLDVLKPFFNHQSPVTAIAAIQDLEVLSTLNLKVPLRDEPQAETHV